MFKNEFPEKDKFDKMTIKIESDLIGVAMTQTDFIITMFQELNTLIIDLDLEIAVYMFEKPLIVKIIKIYYDENYEVVKLNSSTVSDEILWDEIDVTAREIIINDIHNSYKAEVIKSHFIKDNNSTEH